MKGTQMTRDDDPAIIDQAIAWHLRQADMTDGDWWHFIAWLERNPAHAAAYDRIASQDRTLPTPEAQTPANDDRPYWRRWPVFAGGAAAAAVALALAIPMTMQAPAPETYVVETG